MVAKLATKYTMEALEEGDNRIPDNECNDGDESKDRVWYGEAGFINWQ